MPRKNSRKPCLLTQNKYLRDPKLRRMLTELTVRESCAMEGVFPPRAKRRKVKPAVSA